MFLTIFFHRPTGKTTMSSAQERLCDLVTMEGLRNCLRKIEIPASFPDDLLRKADFRDRLALELINIMLTHSATRPWLRHEYALALKGQESSVFSRAKVMAEANARGPIDFQVPVRLPRTYTVSRASLAGGGGSHCCGCKSADNDVDVNLYGISRACPSLVKGEHDMCMLCAGGKNPIYESVRVTLDPMPMPSLEDVMLTKYDLMHVRKAMRWLGPHVELGWPWIKDVIQKSGKTI